MYQLIRASARFAEEHTNRAALDTDEPLCPV
jgi:hypothetical protein